VRPGEEKANTRSGLLDLHAVASRDHASMNLDQHNVNKFLDGVDTFLLDCDGSFETMAYNVKLRNLRDMD
jgi:hypothetical protein